MKRQTFIEIIEDIKWQAWQDRETTKRLADIMIDCTGFYATRLITSIIIALEAEFDDADQTISWWLWDAQRLKAAILLTKNAANSGISPTQASYMIIWSKCRNI